MDKYEEIVNKYDFLSTSLLSEVPQGWLDLVDKMCSEIQEVVKRKGLEYYVYQCKEKYGTLRWYDIGGDLEIFNITSEYEELSSDICCGCGKPATKYSTGWICPWCDDCAEKIGGEFKDL